MRGDGDVHAASREHFAVCFATGGMRMHDQGRQVGTDRVACRPRLDIVTAVESGREMKRAALAHFTVDPDPSLHQLDQLGGDGESQSRAAEPPRGGGVGLAEGFENVLLLVLGNADSRITHDEVHVHLLRGQSVPAARRRRLLLAR